jgi:hypothetical protein
LTTLEFRILGNDCTSISLEILRISASSQRISKPSPSKSSASSKTIHTRHGGDSAFCVTTAVSMDRFAYMHQSGGNQATPLFRRSGNGFGLARLIGNAY